MNNSLPNDVEELDRDQLRWRLAKIKEVLGITQAGPFIYAADSQQSDQLISYSEMFESLLPLTKGPLYVHYYKGGMVKVRLTHFQRFWGSGHYYCTLFDDTFSWFVFTDDNSEDTDSARLVTRK